MLELSVLAHQFSSGKAVHLRHREVHQDNVRRLLIGQGHCRLAISGFKDDIPLLLQREAHEEAGVFNILHQ